MDEKQIIGPLTEEQTAALARAAIASLPLDRRVQVILSLTDNDDLFKEELLGFLEEDEQPN